MTAQQTRETGSLAATRLARCSLSLVCASALSATPGERRLNIPRCVALGYERKSLMRQPIIPTPAVTLSL